MKKLNTKTLMVITLFLASFMATPMIVAGYNNDEGFDLDQFPIPIGGSEIISTFEFALGGIFGSMGYSGQILGNVFMMLLMQGLVNFSQKEMLDGVYVLSAFQEYTHSGNNSYSDEKDYYMLPYEYYLANNSNVNGYAYCEVTRNGGYDYEVTVGAGVTLVIWDNDNSFITAVKKIIGFFHTLRTYEQTYGFGAEIPETLIKEGVELITWFLIHINDIFTGDELFALNPITWQNMKITPWPNYSISKVWMDSNDDIIGGGALDTPIADTSAWEAMAAARSDDYMSWLFDPVGVSLVETIFTSFTFDLIQLWVKEFFISIDVAAILDLLGGGMGGPVDIAAIFQGLNVEFYLFTHHLAGAFLYNDSIIPDGSMTVQYEDLPMTVGGVNVSVPRTSEVTHRLVLGSVGDFDFQLPEVSTDGTKISWGLDLDTVEISPVPVGVNLDSYLGTTPDILDYIHFGFTFEPKKVKIQTANGNSVPVLNGAIKLDQFFSPWNGGAGSVNSIAGLDLAIVFVSTMLHFKLDLDVIGQDPEGTTLLDPAQDYNNVTHRLRIGNYLGDRFTGHLDFVDIAGPDYTYGPEGSTTTAPASTSIIPLALWETEVKRHDTFTEENTGQPIETFATDIGLDISFNVMLYAVCFPMFEDGNGIWHDPTFSVYMIFEATGFWALILLIAGVGLVGIATILIKRRKDARF